VSRWWLLATLLATGLIPLGLLSYFAVDLGGRAVDRRVKENLTTSASISALYFREELRGLAEVDTSFATRPSLVEALAGGDKSRYDRSFIRGTLEQLSRVRPGIGTAFLADSKGRLVDIVPATPSIVGKSFAFRDWYRGVTRTGRAYVSQAYESQAVGHPLVVAVAAPIREPSGRRSGIIVAAYRLDPIHAFAAAFARAQGVSLTITDQRGGLVADARRRAKPLSPRRADPRVAAALGGRSGIAESGRGGDSVLSAYAPVPGIGWTVIAEIPSSRAFAAVHDLRRTVTLIAALLAVLLCGGIALLSRVLRLRQVAESRTQTVLDATVDGIQLTDLAGRPVLSNATYDRLIGGHSGRAGGAPKPGRRRGHGLPAHTA